MLPEESGAVVCGREHPRFSKKDSLPNPNDSRVKTLSGWLAWAGRELEALGPEESRAGAERFLENITGLQRFELYLKASSLLSVSQVQKLKRFVARRKNREPVSYILKKASFWKQVLRVDAGCLIPRPETEILVESFIRESGFKKQDSLGFLDLGCGSGAIGIALLDHFQKAQGCFADVSEEALRIARRNLADGGWLERAVVRHSDFFEAFKKPPQRFDAVLSNPPYFAQEDWVEVEPEIFYEPRGAFDGGRDGLDFYRRFSAEAPAFLEENGILALEVGAGQASKVSKFLQQSFGNIRIFKDHAGIERVIMAKKK